MENSKIQWCDHTFNPWMGCTRVSDGCKHCYAETMMDHRYGKVKWGPQGKRIRTAQAYWKQPLKWNEGVWVECDTCGLRQELDEHGQCPKCQRPMVATMRRVRARVFCASLADVFELKEDQKEEMDQWRSDLFGLIEITPNLDWLLLTKRPENVRRMVPWNSSYPDNVWIGTSVEDQDAVNKRIPQLLKIPAKVRFVSCEPLLGPVALDGGLNFDRKTYPCDYEIRWGHGGGVEGWNTLTGEFRYYRESDGEPSELWLDDTIDWVICGGESGPDARPMNPDWARSLLKQCREADVPFFFKQWGEWMPRSHMWYAGLKEDMTFKKKPVQMGNEMMVPVGKHRSGNFLDGLEWEEFPILNRHRIGEE